MKLTINIPDNLIEMPGYPELVVKHTRLRSAVEIALMELKQADEAGGENAGTQHLRWARVRLETALEDTKS